MGTLTTVVGCLVYTAAYYYYLLLLQLPSKAAVLGSSSATVVLVLRTIQQWWSFRSAREEQYHIVLPLVQFIATIDINITRSNSIVVQVLLFLMGGGSCWYWKKGSIAIGMGEGAVATRQNTIAIYCNTFNTRSRNYRALVRRDCWQYLAPPTRLFRRSWTPPMTFETLSESRLRLRAGRRRWRRCVESLPNRWCIEMTTVYYPILKNIMN